MSTQIITSLLDTDLYKFTMGQIVHLKYPFSIVEYEFTCRANTIFNSVAFDLIAKNISNLKNLAFTNDEIEYLRSIKGIDGQNLFCEAYLEFLTRFQFDPVNEISVMNVGDGTLRIHIRGAWQNVIYYEVPVLAIISEAYYRTSCSQYEYSCAVIEAEKRISEKKDWMRHNSDIRISEFGTRRRFSRAMQENVVSTFSDCTNFIGTSNVILAKRYNIDPIGTMAHEFLMAFQSTNHIEQSDKKALYVWNEFYKGNLSIALTDTLGSNHFFKIFNQELSLRYTGLRQDSGDPIEFGKKAIKHYEKYGIDPTEKTIVFSDSLNFSKIEQIHNTFNGKFKDIYGVGTYLTNDTGLKPLNIVIKMTKCDYYPLIKISDTKEKAICIDENLKQFAINHFK